jgi:hypothetical protein
MKKTGIAFLLSAITCIVLFAFAGCTDKANQINSITDIEYYADMQSGGDKIDVSFENGKRGGFQFTIEDKSNIDEIVNLVLTAKLTNLGNAPPAPGNNTSFTIHQGAKSYGISSNGINVDNNRYVLSTNNKLNEKITAIATEKGAFDTEIGVIYKVIELTDIESVSEEKITVDNNTALLNLLSSDFADCEYFYLFDSENSAERYYTTGITENKLAAYQYKAHVTTGKGKLVVMWHIFQNYNSTSYYLTRPSLSEINLGNTTSSAYTEFAFGLWHNHYLTIYYI